MSALIPSLVPSFIVEPVLRQARRFSRGSFAAPAAAPLAADAATTAAAGPASPQGEEAGVSHEWGGNVGRSRLEEHPFESDGEDTGTRTNADRRSPPRRGSGRVSTGVVTTAGSPVGGGGSGLGLNPEPGPQPSSSSPNPHVPAGPPRDMGLHSSRQLDPTTSTVEDASIGESRGGVLGREGVSSTREEYTSGTPGGDDVTHLSAAQAVTQLDMAERDPEGPSSSSSQDAAPRRPSPPDDFGEGSELAMPLEYLRAEALPEDDGMGPLRKRILEVQSRPIPAAEKALLLHGLFMEGYARSRQLQQQQQQQKKQQRSPSSSSSVDRPCTPGGSGSGGDGGPSTVLYEQPLAQGPLESLKFWQMSLGEPSTPPRFLLTEDDLRPTYVPSNGSHGGGSSGGSRQWGESGSRSGNPSGSQHPQREERYLGCEHYRRNVKLQCNTCQKWYTCRLCHDDAEDHTLPRKETRNMLCMPCGYAQKASDECVRCGRLAARYYCGVCKLWNDDPDRSTYHCNDCGICRVGAGLGKDFFHCKSCGICLAIETKDSHRCREGAMDCNCPICGEYMFTSTKRMIHMNPCRHLIHKRCYDEHMLTSYKCPICSKSTRNMESLFRKWDQNIEEQPMPPEWRDARAIIYCNDCEAKSQTLYHWVGLKCSICQGYNTRELQVLNAPGSSGGGGSAAGGGEDQQEEQQSLDSLPSEARAVPTGSSLVPPIPRGGLEVDTPGIRASASSASVATITAATATGPSSAAAAAAITAHVPSAARDIVPPRRSVSHAPGASIGGMRTTLPMLPPERYARSLSPTPVFATNPTAADEDADMDDDDGRSNDLLDFDFWGRVGLLRTGSGRLRLPASVGGDGGGEDEEEDDEDESSEEDGDDDELDRLEDDEEDDDDEISLFGHR